MVPLGFVINGFTKGSWSEAFFFAVAVAVDGTNDAPALHAADVGISVDTAVDIAKESADIILLDRSLLVLDEGVLEGRKVFSNIVKYVRMGASSNFANMFSVLGASVFVPFLPMRPIQILANNLLYDIGQAAIPTDAVDAEQIGKPRTWDLKELTRFILLIGPCSSIFDYSTYSLMLYVFDCWNVSTPEAAAQPVSGRLVRREPPHTDPHHPRDSHQQGPIPAESAVRVPVAHERSDHVRRRGAAVYPARPLPRVHGTAGALLALHRAHASQLRGPYTGRESLNYNFAGIISFHDAT